MHSNRLSVSYEFLTVLACCLAMVAAPAANAEDKPAEPVKTSEVKVKDITLTVPETWAQQEPANKLRLAQFSIAPAEGDENAVELTVFSFGGSSVQANVDRWISQFDSKGRNAKVTQGQSPQGKYVFVDLSGSFNMPVGPPIQRKTTKVEDARMLAVILIVEDKGVYFLKMAGETKTITAAEKAFRASFGADAAKEKPLEQPGENSEDKDKSDN